ncbi:hypothetical protein NIES4075_23520 [Tolypothrix sp. NIES-4075]|nr:hypothetical protein [Tolypothrix sp. NIES-4075]GAX41382.1 hypothetical protein NIES4075_23520 [Tolypothrix sp. NIES-4075]
MVKVCSNRAGDTVGAQQCCAPTAWSIYLKIAVMFAGRYNRIVTRHNRIVTRHNRIVTRCDRIVTRCDRIVTRCDRIVTRCDRIVTRYNMMTKPQDAFWYSQNFVGCVVARATHDSSRVRYG